MSVMEVKFFSGSAAEEQEALIACLDAEPSGAELWLWQYDSPSIILGCSQRRQLESWQQAVVDKGYNVDVMARRAGGGVVLAGTNMLSASLILPHGKKDIGLVTSFEWFGRAWQLALNAQGIKSRLAAPDDFTHFKALAAERIGWICFAGLSHGELLDADGKKLVGLAQIRKRHATAIVSGVITGPQDWGMVIDLYPELSSNEGQSALTLLDDMVASERLALDQAALGHALQAALNSECLM